MTDRSARRLAAALAVSLTVPFTFVATRADAAPAAGCAQLDTWSGAPGFRLADVVASSAPSGSQSLADTCLTPVKVGKRSTPAAYRWRTRLDVPVTTTVRFSLASDDEGVLDIAPLTDPAARTVLARVHTWATYHQFGELGDPDQKSVPQTLAPGSYLLEAWVKDGGGAGLLDVNLNLGAGYAVTNSGYPVGITMTATTAGCTGWCPPTAAKVEVPGTGARMDTFAGYAGAALTDIPSEAAASTSASSPQFEAPRDRTGAPGTRLVATVTVPVTGTYWPMLAGDDQAVLEVERGAGLGPLVTARVTSATPARTYDLEPDQVSGAGNVAGGFGLNAGDVITLVAYGKDGGGANHLSVGWRVEGSGADGRVFLDQPVIPAEFLHPVAAQQLGWSPSADAVHHDLAEVDEAVWTGVAGKRLTDVAQGTPAASSSTTIALVDTAAGANSATRMRAVFTAPTAGAYRFWVAGDDQALLDAAPITDPGARTVLAWSKRWTAPFAYDQAHTQRSKPVTLAAGQQLVVEVWAKHGGGANHVEVAWAGPDGHRRVLRQNDLTSPTRPWPWILTPFAGVPACAGWCPPAMP